MVVGWLGCGLFSYIGASGYSLSEPALVLPVRTWVFTSVAALFLGMSFMALQLALWGSEMRKNISTPAGIVIATWALAIISAYQAGWTISVAVSIIASAGLTLALLGLYILTRNQNTHLRD
jgi:hypothetical protein